MPNVTVSQSPKVYIERHVWRKMFGWCRAATSECSGYGLVKLENGIFKVYDVFFPLQYCSSGYTEIDDLANHRLQDKLAKRKLPPEHFRFWWHTHYNFGTFWSGTDTSNAREQVNYNQEWEVSLVINQNGDHLCRVDYEKPFAGTFDECEVFLMPNSQKRKRKRNFKSDVLRYVKTMEQMPERQKPKFHNINEGIQVMVPRMVPYSPTPYQNMANGNDWETSWRERWQERQNDYLANQDTFHWGSPTVEKEVEKEMTKDPSRPIRFGRYILYEGKLITEDTYDRMMSGLPDKEIEKCPCGDEGCINHSMCLPCMMCGIGRFQAANGFCPTCYANINGGVEHAVSKSDGPAKS